MKLTKANLQKIIQEEIENLMSEEDDEYEKKFPGLKADVEALAQDQEDVHITDPRATVGTTLPGWLTKGKPSKLEKLEKKYPGLKQLKEKDPVKFKKALGLKTIESPYAKRMRLLQKGK